MVVWESHDRWKRWMKFKKIMTWNCRGMRSSCFITIFWTKLVSSFELGGQFYTYYWNKLQSQSLLPKATKCVNNKYLIISFILLDLEKEENPQWKLVPGSYSRADVCRFFLHYMTSCKGCLRFYSNWLGVPRETLRLIWKFMAKKVINKEEKKVVLYLSVTTYILGMLYRQPVSGKATFNQKNWKKG